MTTEAPSSDQKRVRAGLLVLALGVVLFLWAWGSWIFRTSTSSSEMPSAAGREASPETVQAVRTMPAVLLIGLFLVLVFLAATYAIARSSRRFRELIFRQRATPTASDDVWAMHKPPAATDDD